VIFEKSPRTGTGSTAPSSAATEASGIEPGKAEPRSFHGIADTRIALARKARAESVTLLNRVLAGTMTLRDLYKKHLWQASGATFYPLHLLCDKHHDEQAELIDLISERILTLGGTSIAMAADVAATTLLSRPPRDREESSLQLARLADAHERVLHNVRAAARRATELGDYGTNDLLAGDVIRTNEKQAWIIHDQSQRSRASAQR
jgi:starvation-inducible DNA-binding protein